MDHLVRASLAEDKWKPLSTWSLIFQAASLSVFTAWSWQQENRGDAEGLWKLTLKTSTRSRSLHPFGQSKSPRQHRFEGLEKDPLLEGQNSKDFEAICNTRTLLFSGCNWAGLPRGCLLFCLLYLSGFLTPFTTLVPPFLNNHCQSSQWKRTSLFNFSFLQLLE